MAVSCLQSLMQTQQKVWECKFSNSPKLSVVLASGRHVNTCAIFWFLLNLNIDLLPDEKNLCLRKILSFYFCSNCPKKPIYIKKTQKCLNINKRNKSVVGFQWNVYYQNSDYWSYCDKTERELCICHIYIYSSLLLFLLSCPFWRWWCPI